jgi:hypothetical protein
VGIIWASDFKFEIVDESIKPTGKPTSSRAEQRNPSDSITQELRDNLRKLSLGPPAKNSTPPVQEEKL